MALFVNITNPPLEDFEETSLSKSSSIAATVLDVLSGLGFKVNQILLIGNYEEENAEVVKTHASTAPTDTQITLAAGAKFAHSTNTPVRLMPFDKFRIYQSNDGGQTYFLADTIDIRPDKIQTVYISPATTAAKFKIASYNSLTGLEGTLSDAIDGTGLDFGAVGAILDRVYDLYTDPSQKFIKSDEALLNYLNEGILDMWVRMTGLGKGYGVKRTGTSSDPDVSLVSGQNLYSFLSDMLRPLKVALDYSNSGKFVRAKKFDPLLVDDENYFSESDPRHTLHHNQIEINPKPKSSAGKMRLWYVFIPAPLISTTEKPKLPAVYLATKTLVDFCIARIYEKAYKPERASYFLQAYENGVTAWISAISVRSAEPEAVHLFGEDLEGGSNAVIY
jgi:hypothetical protein